MSGASGNKLESLLAAEGNDLKLPPLRKDLRISRSDIGNSGMSMWTIYDPLQQRYFQIDDQTKDLLSLWRKGQSISDFLELVHQRLGVSLDQDQLIGFLDFVRKSHLTDEERQGNWSDLDQSVDKNQKSLFTRLAHHYLFFKIPLFRPQRTLKAIGPFFEPFYNWWFISTVGLIGLIGLYLVSRQWDTFINTFHEVFSFEGAVYLALALVLLKSAHELGHALTAVRYGCYVPHMGVAFMLMMPLLYTDVTDAWRLPSRRQRILIGAAGILVELGMACLATFLWAFLPDGSARGIAFMVATTGWFLSITFNLNPCMKFDGYYLLGDLTGIDNLQPRAFALGRWKLRQILFAPNLEPPEQFSRSMNAYLIMYAWITWVFRFILFTTIAILVYYFCFKLLGIFLFLLEIWFLIALPISKEIKAWWSIDPSKTSKKRVLGTTSVAFALLLILVMPWSTRIEVPAVLEASELAQVYPPRAAKVVAVEVQHGDSVNKNSPLISLHVPEIENDIALTRAEIDVRKLRLARMIVDNIDREEALVLRHELDSLQTKIEGLHKQRGELLIRSPISGTILEMEPHLHPGRWIRKLDRIGLISAQKQHIIKGYISEVSLYRLETGAEGQFIPDDLTRSSIPVRLKSIAQAGAVSIDVLELTSKNEGPIPVQPDKGDKLVPIDAQYFVELEPLDPIRPPEKIIRGIVDLRGSPESLLSRIWNQVAKVFVRETGF